MSKHIRLNLAERVYFNSGQEREARRFCDYLRISRKLPAMLMRDHTLWVVGMDGCPNFPFEWTPDYTLRCLQNLGITCRCISYYTVPENDGMKQSAQAEGVEFTLTDDPYEALFDKPD